MDGMIKCSVCGENNSVELDYCQKCNSRLHVQDESLKSGDLPDKKKNTAELEPILPQWLRDARQQARQTSDDDLSIGMEAPKSHSPLETPVPNVDFLAGLGSHANDENEEETPDWLASITGVSSKPKKNEAETTDVRWVEVGGKDDFAQDAPTQDAENETPSWLANIQSQPKSEKDELTDWFKEAANPSTPQDSGWMGQSEKKNDFMSQDSELVSSNDTPDWLHQMQADDIAKNEPAQPTQSFGSNDDTPDWLKSMGGNDSIQSNPIQAGQAFDAGDDAPDWLKRMDEKEPAKNTGMDTGNQAFSINDDVPAWLQQPGTQEPVDNDVPSWLNAIDSQQKDQLDPAPFSEPAAGGQEAGFASLDDTPDWLKSTQPEEPKASPLKGTSPLWLRDSSEADSADVPAWLSPSPSIEETPAPAFDETKQEDIDLGDNVPSWLKAAAPQSSIFSEPAAGQDQAQAFSSDTPDWLSAFKSVEDSQPPSPFSNDIQADSDVPAPAFTENSFEGLGDNALFTEMPDWLSNASDTPAGDVSPAINTADSLAAGELPSWVQAMRPVEGSRQGPSNSTDQTLEARGALAGLQGVLPSVPGFAPSSKPRAYSILLQATEEQQSHALLLEQILAAEAEPQPIASYAPLVASRPLRWFITALVFIFVTVGLSLGTPAFSIPSIPLNTNNPLNDALYVVQHIPDNSQVLVVMDYQPSRAAELEAAALPVFDQMDLLHHPGLYFVSTNEMGSILTERLVSLSFTFNSMKSLRARYQEAGQALINLGYLPGGEMGVRAFVQNPFVVKPLDVAGSPSGLQEKISINQFVAIIIMTDNADTGRAWIEQTHILEYPFPLIFVTSSQAAPMLQPYYDSGQVKGLVNGLYDGAVVEDNDAKRFVTARSYWDSYSLGMWLAMLLLILGGLWNLALGVRDRSMAREII